MAIRLNLLAESQAAEEMRRKDPVKRSIWVSALLIALVFTWAVTLQLRAFITGSEVSHFESQMKAHANDFKVVQENQRKGDDIRERITALRNLSANRFLQASALNALQHTTVEDVQLVHYQSEQSYAVTESVKARTNENNRVIAGKPGTSTERITLTLEGTDSSANPGDQVNRFKEVVAAYPWFREALGKTNLVNLKSLGRRQTLPIPGSVTSKECVLFTVECRLPERTR